LLFTTYPTFIHNNRIFFWTIGAKRRANKDKKKRAQLNGRVQKNAFFDCMSIFTLLFPNLFDGVHDCYNHTDTPQKYK
jgi:hypothetical protein